jgi:phosphoribosylaminoimidazole-succinocarboxamide synthase
MYYEIQDQIEDIKKVTEMVSKSKESAIKFLIDAGIILEDAKEEKKDNVSFLCPDNK